MAKENSSCSRRDLLRSGLAGLTGTSLALSAPRAISAGDSTASMHARPPHFPARAKRVIFLFMLGGPSQLDLFDDKPKLRELDGQPIGDEFLSRMKFAQIM